MRYILLLVFLANILLAQEKQEIQSLIEVLQSGNENKIKRACDKLIRYGPLARKATPALAQLLIAPDTNRRLSEIIGKALVVIGPAPDTLDILGKGLKSRKYHVQQSAAAALAKMGKAAKKYVPDLILLLGDEDYGDTAEFAAFALAHIAPDPSVKAAIPALMKKLDRPGPTAYQAAIVLIKLDPKNKKALDSFYNVAPLFLQEMERELGKSAVSPEMIVFCVQFCEFMQFLPDAKFNAQLEEWAHSSHSKLQNAAKVALEKTKKDTKSAHESVGIKFWSALKNADTQTMASIYADEVTLSAGCELLKERWGINPGGSRDQANTFKREKLIEGYKKLIKGLGKEKWLNVFGEMQAKSEFVEVDKSQLEKFKFLSVHLGDFVMIVHTGPGDDKVAFVLREIEGNWRVVAEYSDY